MTTVTGLPIVNSGYEEDTSDLRGVETGTLWAHWEWPEAWQNQPMSELLAQDRTEIGMWDIFLEIFYH